MSDVEIALIANTWTAVWYKWVIPSQVLFAAGVHATRPGSGKRNVAAPALLAAWFVNACGKHHAAVARALLEGGEAHASLRTDVEMAIATGAFGVTAGVMLALYTYRAFRSGIGG